MVFRHGTADSVSDNGKLQREIEGLNKTIDAWETTMRAVTGEPEPDINAVAAFVYALKAELKEEIERHKSEIADSDRLFKELHTQFADSQQREAAAATREAAMLAVVETSLASRAAYDKYIRLFEAASDLPNDKINRASEELERTDIQEAKAVDAYRAAL